MMHGTEVIDSDSDSEACYGLYAEDVRVLGVRVQLRFGLGGGAVRGPRPISVRRSGSTVWALYRMNTPAFWDLLVFGPAANLGT